MQTMLLGTHSWSASCLVGKMHLPVCNGAAKGDPSKHTFLAARSNLSAVCRSAPRPARSRQWTPGMPLDSHAIMPMVAVTQEAAQQLSNSRVATFEEIFIQMRRILSPTTFTFNDEATVTLQNINDQFITEVNDAITNGTPTPTSKVFDLVQRVAVSLHIFNYIALAMLHGD